jgi:hypothetical protein
MIAAIISVAPASYINPRARKNAGDIVEPLLR